MMVTEKQMEQMQALADEGHTAKQISEIMNISISTVRTHCEPKISEYKRWKIDFKRRWDETRKIFAR